MPSLRATSLNVRGVGGEHGFASLLGTAKITRKKQRDILMIQEHNLNPVKHQNYVDTAKLKGFTLVISYGRADDEESRRGGVLILTNDKTTTLNSVLNREPGFIRIKVEWGTETLEFANVYAPARPLPRVDYYNALRDKLSPNTIVGGDWNTVGDVTLDVQSANPLGYPNIGSTLLHTIMSDKGLVDERREQLGNDSEYTRDGNSTNGWISTRLDRWYVPGTMDCLWTFEVDNSFIFKEKASDHRAVTVIIDNQLGEMGKERVTINEDLCSDPVIQTSIKEIVEKAYEGNKSERAKWERAHDKLYAFLLGKTKERKAKDKAEILQLEAQLAVVNARAKKHGQCDERARHEKRLQKEIFEKKHPEVLREPTEKEARGMFERSEISSKAMFATYKGQAKQQWINTMKQAQWEEGKEPVFTGSTSNVKNIGSEFVKFYKMIFAEKEIHEGWAKKILKKMATKSLLKESRESLDRPFSLPEVYHTMENLPLYKQAGPNRLPNALYKRCPTIFAERFMNMINESRTTGKLPKHFLEGDISMLYKKDARDDPRHYRPITLLNADYKIFTRILAKRMGTVVHQFVSECQKGFVPDTFIAEATMLLRMTEAYINEEPTSRQGAFLFLDMEKAFDRVSYEFTNRGLEALGFGKHFRKWVGMMYDTKNAPKRRMYVNGYYSEEFKIKSGVAQGCPLSPLLFLIVAEGLKISMDMEPNFKGIDVNGALHRILQFADDTTIFMGDIAEEKYVTRALNRWCLATGMRENMKKREGLGMGKYRGQDLGHGIKWASHDGWCISLGVPIGNDLKEAKWWGEKINKVRSISKQWIGLKRAQYFGRNLIVQGCFLGRLRYWLYSLGMDAKTRAVVQRDADILWWSREPTLEEGTAATGHAEKNKKRIKRWVAKDTAIGPRDQGGLNNMDWNIHVDAFEQRWMTRYLDPGSASWKDMLDSFILYDKKGNLKYPEGRSIILQNLSTREKAAMISRIPKGATYIKGCLRKFWKLKLAPKANSWKGIGTESPWHGHRFHTSTSNANRAFFKHTVEITQMSDFMNKDTNRPFSRKDWRSMIQKENTNKGNKPLTNIEIIDYANEITKIQHTIPRLAWIQMMRQYVVAPTPKMRVYLIRQKSNIVWPAIVTDNTKAQRVWIDPRGRGHVQQKWLEMRHFDIVKAYDWDGKWAGPQGASTPLDTEWNYIKNFRDLTINSITKGRQLEKMVPPASEKAWTDHNVDVPWKKMWKAKAMYASPRDTAVLLKLQHRTLWVAKNGGMNGTTCAVHGCAHEENMQHLMTCTTIKRDYWELIAEYLRHFNMHAENTEEFWLGCQRGKAANGETLGAIAIAWRALYAEVTKAHAEDKHLRLDKAYFAFTRLLLGRVKAYGAKWRRWYNNQRLWQPAKTKHFPMKHRNKKLIQTEADATYQIHPDMETKMKEAHPLNAT